MISHRYNTGVEVQENRLTRAQETVIKTLLYFDIFEYPLTSNEIFQNCDDGGVSQKEINNILFELKSAGFIYESENYYFVQPRKEMVEHRKKGNRLAEHYLKIAGRMSMLLSNFPFVRGISLSGSLSKGFMDPRSDIDYFIITEPKRLWLSRTLMVLFKKLFLLNSKKWLCINYFIDDKSLVIPDQNLFVATEILYLIPTYNYSLHRKFLASNSWVKDFKPNFHPNGKEYEIHRKPLALKRWSEILLGGRLGDKLDDICFELTYRYWKKKFKHLREDEFEKAFRSKKNVSKHHPRNFQKLVMLKLEEKITWFEQTHDVLLNR